MTSIIKSVSDTTTNVLTTVGTLANQLTHTVNTAGQGLDMLNSFVTTARAKQVARTAVDMHTFYEELAEDTAAASAERQKALRAKLAQDTEFKNLFEINHKSISDLITAIRNPTVTE